MFLKSYFEEFFSFFAEVPAEFSFMFQVLKWNLALK